MLKSRHEARASLIIISETRSGSEIADILQLKASKVIAKGTPTGQTDVPEHPINMAMFVSGLGPQEDLLDHIEAILNMCETAKGSLLKLVQDCTLTIHCNYLVCGEGGWTFTPNLFQRMASLPLQYVFSVDTLI